MNKAVFLLTLLSILVILVSTGCGEKSTSKRPDLDNSVLTMPDSLDFVPGDVTEHIRSKRKTRIRFDGFTVVINEFSFYAFEMHNGKKRVASWTRVNARFNEEEKGDPLCKETLIAQKDTVYLSETGEIELENGEEGSWIGTQLIELLSHNKRDTYKVAYCYLIRLDEQFNREDRTYEQVQQLYENGWSAEVCTKFKPVKDSAGRYFRVFPVTSDPWTFFDFDKETAIKKHYHLRDTSVNIGDEYDHEVRYTSKGRLIDHTEESIIIRIERYSNNRLAETKYIRVHRDQGGC